MEDHELRYERETRNTSNKPATSTNQHSQMMAGTRSSNSQSTSSSSSVAYNDGNSNLEFAKYLLDTHQITPTQYQLMTGSVTLGAKQFERVMEDWNAYTPTTSQRTTQTSTSNAPWITRGTGLLQEIGGLTEVAIGLGWSETGIGAFHIITHKP